MHIEATTPAGTRMKSDPTTSADDRQPRLLAIIRARDAQIALIDTSLTVDEAERLEKVLARLVEIGVLAFYGFGLPLEHATCWRQISVFMHEHLGELPFDAVEAAAPYAATPTPKPDMLVPVWVFEPLNDHPGVLAASGLFAGQPIEFEALPVEDADLTVPLPHVAARFATWRAAAGRGAILGTAAIPGRDGAYAVFASMRAG